MKLFNDTKIAHYNQASGLTHEQFKEEQINLAIEKYHKSALESRKKWRFFYDQSHVKFIHGVTISSTREKCPTYEEISYAQFCMWSWYLLKTRQLDAYEAFCLKHSIYPRRLAIPPKKTDYEGVCTDIFEPEHEEDKKYFFEAVEFIDKPNIDEARIYFTDHEWLYFPRTCSYYLDISGDDLFVSNKPIENIDVDFYLGVYKLTSEQKSNLFQTDLEVGQELPYFIGHLDKLNSRDYVNPFHPYSYYYAYPLPTLVQLEEKSVEIERIIKTISAIHYEYAKERKEKGLLVQADAHLTASKLIKQNVLEYRNFVEKSKIVNHCDAITDYISGAETFYYDI
jgi:hypothetical protein